MLSINKIHMKKLIIVPILFLSLYILPTSVYAQADTLVKVCTQHLQVPYISDGQQYQTILNEEEIAEFHATFYGGSRYRVVGCSGLSDGNLVYSVYDKERNLLFTNSDFENAPYWDFKFENTMDCIIEAKLDYKNNKSGFAIMLIGFKQ